MSADLLRRAAKAIREKAEAACTGDGDSLSRTWFAAADWHLSEWDVVAQDEGSYIAHGLHKSQAEHIAAWHPAIALAVADWLDSVAVGFENRSAFTPHAHHAVAVARAFLGEEAS